MFELSQIQNYPTPEIFIRLVLGGAVITTFAGPATAFTAGRTKYAFAHGLGAKPQLCWAVMRCTTNDAASGAVVGQELKCEFLIDSFSGSPQDAFMVKADATNITVSTNDDYAGGGFGSLQLVSDTGGGGAVGISNITNFQLVVYALHF